MRCTRINLSVLMIAVIAGAAIISLMAGTASADTVSSDCDLVVGVEYFNGKTLADSDISEEQLSNANEPDFQRTAYFSGRLMTASDLASKQTRSAEESESDARNHYFSGKMLEAHDLQSEQSYNKTRC